MKNKNASKRNAAARSSLARGSGTFSFIGRTRVLEDGRKISEIEVLERVGTDRCVLFRTVGAVDHRTRKLVSVIVDFLNNKISNAPSSAEGKA